MKNKCNFSKRDKASVLSDHFTASAIQKQYIFFFFMENDFFSVDKYEHISMVGMGREFGI